jgi:hypothetical protein
MGRMPMLTRKSPAIAGLACWLLGCQTVDLTDDLNEYAGLANEAEIRPCDCYQELGFQSLAECTDPLDSLSQADLECLDAALQGHERDGQEYLDCKNAALGDYVQCVAANVDCEPGVNDGCLSVYTVAAAGCTQLPSDVQAAFTACTD